MSIDLDMTEDRLQDRHNNPRCFRLLRWYGNHEDLGDYLIALGTAVRNKDGDELTDLVVNHNGFTEDIDFNWGSSGP